MNNHFSNILQKRRLVFSFVKLKLVSFLLTSSIQLTNRPQRTEKLKQKKIFKALGLTEEEATEKLKQKHHGSNYYQNLIY